MSKTDNGLKWPKSCFKCFKLMTKISFPMPSQMMKLVTPIVGVCNCSMFCCTLLYVHSSIAIILMGQKELIVLLYLSSCCLVTVERLFLVVLWGCLRFVIVVFLIILTYYFLVHYFEPIRKVSNKVWATKHSKR